MLEEGKREFMIDVLPTLGKPTKAIVTSGLPLVKVDKAEIKACREGPAAADEDGSEGDDV